MKLIIKITSALLLTALLTLNTSIKAFADDDKEDFTREEIIEMFWGEHWNSSDEGIKNPEGSLEYHILETWLDEQYGHTSYESDKKYTVRDWSSRESIRKSWRKYHEEYTDNWHYNDDKDTGEFTIEEYDPDTEEIVGLLYSFELKDGMWNMVDKNGDIADRFEPHGGDGSARALKEDDQDDIDDFLKGMSSDSSSDIESSDDDNEEKYAANENGEPIKASSDSSSDEENSKPNVSNEQGNSPRVKGETPSSETATEDNSNAQEDVSETETEENSSHTYILLISAIAIAVIAIGILFYKKKGK